MRLRERRPPAIPAAHSDERAKVRNGSPAVGTPSHDGVFEAFSNQGHARGLDDAGIDGPPLSHGLGVAHAAAIVARHMRDSLSIRTPRAQVDHRAIDALDTVGLTAQPVSELLEPRRGIGEVGPVDAVGGKLELFGGVFEVDKLDSSRQRSTEEHSIADTFNRLSSSCVGKVLESSVDKAYGHLPLPGVPFGNFMAASRTDHMWTWSAIARKSISFAVPNLHPNPI